MQLLASTCHGWILILAVLLVPIAAGSAPPARATAEDRVDVAVVGAGLAGLVTAYALRKQGFRTRVLEARSAVGGRVATIDYGAGLRAEAALQEIWAGNPLLEIARELGLPLETEHAAHSGVRIAGTIHHSQGEPLREHLDGFLDVDERRGLEAWLDTAKRLHARAQSAGLADAEIAALQELSFHEWVVGSDALSGSARAWLRLHLECELGSDWQGFSALSGLLELAFLFDGGASFSHVVGGNSRLVDALAQAAGPITLSARVTSVAREADPDGLLRVSWVRGGVVESLWARRVVLAIPFYRVHQLHFDPPLPEEHHRALASLGFGQYVSVHLILDAGAPVIETHGALLTEGRLGVLYGEVAADRKGRRVFSLLVHGPDARAFHTAPRARKVDELVAALEEIQPGIADHVLDAHVYTYHPAAIPIWPPGRSPLDALSELLRRPTGGIHFAGDYTESSHSDGAARSALRVARQIRRALAAGEVGRAPVAAAR